MLPFSQGSISSDVNRVLRGVSCVDSHSDTVEAIMNKEYIAALVVVLVIAALVVVVVFPAAQAEIALALEPVQAALEAVPTVTP